MGKVTKRQRPKKQGVKNDFDHARKAVVRRQHSQHVPEKVKQNAFNTRGLMKARSNNANSDAPPKPKNLFSRWDRVLLVGEGDFSFALSLATNHHVGSIVATCFDTKEDLTHKYPTVSRTIEKLSTHHDDLTSIDAENHSGSKHPNGLDDTWEGFSTGNQSESEEECGKGARIERGSRSPMQSTVLYGVDATKLNTLHKRVLKLHVPFTKILFNFPHVGGISTDVNRQVRSNQQLLVNFFNAAKSLLATPYRPAKPISLNDDGLSEEEMESEDDLQDQRGEYLKHGKILVTLFEGEPYTLWNIRDLARHSGLKVLESYKFPWTSYPGYQHARTIGDITHGRDRSDEGRRKGAWRGEERDARCYVLALKDDNDGRPEPGSRKRKHTEDDSD